MEKILRCISITILVVMLYGCSETNTNNFEMDVSLGLTVDEFIEQFNQVAETLNYKIRIDYTKEIKGDLSSGMATYFIEQEMENKKRDIFRITFNFNTDNGEICSFQYAYNFNADWDNMDEIEKAICISILTIPIGIIDDSLSENEISSVISETQRSDRTVTLNGIHYAKYPSSIGLFINGGS
jgi:hypothetical protein